MVDVRRAGVVVIAESWRPVVGMEGRYLVSDQGRIASLPKRGYRETRLLNPTPAKRGGYPVVHLRDGAGGGRMRGVHQLVLEAFVGPRPDGAEALHGDDDPLNCTLSNLRWGTRSENQQDRVRNGRDPNANKTHCIRGHEFTPENTARRSDGTGRCCLECHRIRGRAASKRYYWRQKNEAVA